MAMRAVICKGDPTSHGGMVLEGNPIATANGRPIALKGHMTRCPQCKGDFLIVEGLGFHSFAGVGTVVEGMKTACGAQLIATTTVGFMMIDDRAEAQEALATAAAASVSTANKGRFRAVDEHSGEPVAGVGYRILLPGGAVLRGKTDAGGYTEQVVGHDPSTVDLMWDTDQLVDGA